MEPLTTVAEFVAAGAHRSLEVAAAMGDLDEGKAAHLLVQRYGQRAQPEQGVINRLVSDVLYAVHAAARTKLGDTVESRLIPTLPGYRPGYSYTLIAEFADPLRPQGEGRNVSFPIRVTASAQLTYAQLQQEADRAIREAQAAGQLQIETTINSPPLTANARAMILRESDSEDALPVLSILSVYRGE